MVVKHEMTSRICVVVIKGRVELKLGPVWGQHIISSSIAGGEGGEVVTKSNARFFWEIGVIGCIFVK